MDCSPMGRGRAAASHHVGFVYINPAMLRMEDGKD